MMVVSLVKRLGRYALSVGLLLILAGALLSVGVRGPATLAASPVAEAEAAGQDCVGSVVCCGGSNFMGCVTSSATGTDCNGNTCTVTVGSCDGGATVFLDFEGDC
jgi:hypothetical protein